MGEAREGQGMSPCQVIASGAIVCGPPRGMYRRAVHHCPTCNRRTFGIERWDGAWYGWTYYCAVCLDYFQDGWRGHRPFARYWKRDRAAQIKAMWDGAKPPAEYEAYIRADIHWATCGKALTDEKCAECDTRNAVAYGRPA